MTISQWYEQTRKPYRPILAEDCPGIGLKGETVYTDSDDLEIVGMQLDRYGVMKLYVKRGPVSAYEDAVYIGGGIWI